MRIGAISLGVVILLAGAPLWNANAVVPTGAAMVLPSRQVTSLERVSCSDHVKDKHCSYGFYRSCTNGYCGCRRCPTYYHPGDSAGTSQGGYGSGGGGFAGPSYLQPDWPRNRPGPPPKKQMRQ